MKAKKYLITVVLIAGIMIGGCKDSQDTGTDSPIHTAAILGNLDDIESILAENPELVNARDEEGDTPLHFAMSILGSKEAVKLLIARGANVNAKNNKGATPLHMTFTTLGDKEMVELLVANGADVNVKEDTIGATPLHLAADKGHKDIVEFLISKGADINAKDKIGGTALHHLTMEGQEDDTNMIEFLLSKGADINAKDNMAGGTPLHYASMSGYITIVKFLISKGADAFCEAYDEATPLMLAASEGHNDVADLLRKHMKEVSDLLHAIEEAGSDEEMLVFAEKLKDIAPEMNKKMGNELKQEYTFDWYSRIMLALKMSEQQFRALDMINDANEVNKVVASLEAAWSQGDWHDMLYAKLYALKIDTVLNNIVENMSEEQKQQITIDTIPLKELAQRLLEQSETKK